jgi:TPR repeat protein
MITEVYNLETWNSLLEEAEKGNNMSQLEVAVYYENGIEVNGTEIVNIDETLAYYWTKKAYENGNENALVSYADYLSLGKHCVKNLELAVELYKKAVELGNSQASYNLGVEYRNKQEFETAFEYYKKANQFNKNYEDLTIAKCYYYGIGTQKNRKIALSIFKKIKFPESNQFEVDEANYYAGKIYLEGEVVEKSIEKARYYFELANKDEDHNSANEVLYIIGRTENIK